MSPMSLARMANRKRSTFSSYWRENAQAMRAQGTLATLLRLRYTDELLRKRLPNYALAKARRR